MSLPLLIFESTNCNVSCSSPSSRYNDSKPNAPIAAANHLPSSNELDAFEHILDVTSKQEALYAYYWMDTNNKMKITEIFDMTNSDNPAIQARSEREVNQQLEFESDWNLNQNGKTSTLKTKFGNDTKIPFFQRYFLPFGITKSITQAS